jgi:hypothetical protein
MEAVTVNHKQQVVRLRQLATLHYTLFPILLKVTKGHSLYVLKIFATPPPTFFPIEREVFISKKCDIMTLPTHFVDNRLMQIHIWLRNKEYFHNY